MRFKNTKFIGFIMGTLIFYIIFFFNFFKSDNDISSMHTISFKHVIVHLDLKGSPPKLDYLTNLLPLFKKFGVNGLLMEYEDSFPYYGALVNLSSTIPYDKTKLKYFLTQAVKLDMEIIPLIQTYGHMEHVLKLKQYEHLREAKEYPDSICPSNEESINLIKHMLLQVIQFHMSIAPLKHIHIGCDEVYQLNMCSKCRNRRLLNRYLFLDHVKKVKSLINNLNSSITVLMWDDMFRQIKMYDWDKTVTQIISIEPVYWDYTPELNQTSHINLFRYHKTFNNVWIASAFKGADGIQATLPNLQARFLNHYRWLDHFLKYKYADKRYVFHPKGIILTGWSRYSHLDTLCELLPAALPSLLMNLILIKRFKDGVHVSDTVTNPNAFFDKYIARNLERELKCEENVLNYSINDPTLHTCKHKCGLLMSTLKRHKRIISNIDAQFRNQMSIIPLIEFYSEIQNLNVRHAKNSLKWCRSILKDITRWENTMSVLLSPYYDRFVIEEYIGYKIYSAKRKIKNTLQKLEDYMNVYDWGRRSYNFSFT